MSSFFPLCFVLTCFDFNQKCNSHREMSTRGRLGGGQEVQRSTLFVHIDFFIITHCIIARIVYKSERCTYLCDLLQGWF